MNIDSKTIQDRIVRIQRDHHRICVKGCDIGTQGKLDERMMRNFEFIESKIGPVRVITHKDRTISIVPVN